GLDRIDIRDAPQNRVEQLGIHPLRIAHRLLRTAPEAIGARAEAHPPVLARENPLPSGLAAGQEPLKRSGIAQFVRVKPDVRANHADHREPLPDVDMLPRAITLS